MNYFFHIIVFFHAVTVFIGLEEQVGAFNILSII